MNYNKPFVRVVLIVVLALLTGAYLFTQTTLKPLPPIFHQYHYNNPAALTYPHDRFKAAFYTFVKSDSTTLTRLRYTIRNLEDSFNKEFNYPYIIFTDEHLSTEYQELASSLTKANVLFQRVGSDLYGYPKAIDLKKAAAARVDLNSSMFGDSEDYRFQSRFMAGTIYRHPLMQELDYAWRFEAGTEYVCPIEDDPFQFMMENNKTTSFSMSLYEYPETIPTLYDTVLDFAKENRLLVQQKTDPDSLWHFIWEQGTEEFNRCHLWNNFQIVNVEFYRGQVYQQFFDYLDKSNGIFYERWGDPIIQSLGAVLFLRKQDIHFWDNIGYRVANFFTHCPADKSFYSKCACRPEENFDFNGYSCLRFY